MAGTASAQERMSMVDHGLQRPASVLAGDGSALRGRSATPAKHKRATIASLLALLMLVFAMAPAVAGTNDWEFSGCDMKTKSQFFSGGIPHGDNANINAGCTDLIGVNLKYKVDGGWYSMGWKYSSSWYVSQTKWGQGADQCSTRGNAKVSGAWSSQHTAWCP